MLAHLLHAVRARLSNAGRRLRTLGPRLGGVTVGQGCLIGPRCEVSTGHPPARRGRIILGDRTQLGTSVLLHPYGGTIETGIDVYLGPFTVIYGHGGVTIGKDTLVSMHCRILSSNHEIPASGTIIRSQPDRVAPTRIGRDVWLGAGVTVLAGVTIGDGCVVGAGAVVTRDLPANTIAAGVPARATGLRSQPPLP